MSHLLQTFMSSSQLTDARSYVARLDIDDCLTIVDNGEDVDGAALQGHFASQKFVMVVPDEHEDDSDFCEALAKVIMARYAHPQPVRPSSGHSAHASSDKPKMASKTIVTCLYCEKAFYESRMERHEPLCRVRWEGEQAKKVIWSG